MHLGMHFATEISDYMLFGVKQAFDCIAGNTVVPYWSLKQFFNYHTLLFIVIYNKFQVDGFVCIIATYLHHVLYILHIICIIIIYIF